MNSSRECSLTSSVQNRSQIGHSSSQEVVEESSKEGNSGPIKCHRPIRKLKLKKKFRTCRRFSTLKEYASRSTTPIVECKVTMRNDTNTLTKRDRSHQRDRKFRLLKNKKDRVSFSLKNSDRSQLDFSRTSQRIREFVSSQSGSVFDSNSDIRNFDIKRGIFRTNKAKPYSRFRLRKGHVSQSPSYSRRTEANRTTSKNPEEEHKLKHRVLAMGVTSGQRILERRNSKKRKWKWGL